MLLQYWFFCFHFFICLEYKQQKWGLQIPGEKVFCIDDDFDWKHLGMFDDVDLEFCKNDHYQK